MSAWNRREWLAGMAAGAVASARSAAGPKPNFILVLIDDLGWMDLTCQGSKYYETPHIDRLASRGIRFTDGYAGAPLCCPTRASVLTGKSPARLHMTHQVPYVPGGPMRPKPDQKWIGPAMGQGLPLSEVTIARALKPAGYISASIGKWHLGTAEYYPEKHGFDVNIGGNENGAPSSYFYPQWKGKGRGVPIAEGREGEYLTDRLTEETIRFIESNKDRPFFVYLAHYAVHTFLEAKPEVVEKYKRKADPNNPQHNPVYAAMVESVDDSVGRIVAKLEELKLSDRTVIIFAGDNGGVPKVQTYTKDPFPPTSNLPLNAGKATLYEGGIRVPLIVKAPCVRKPGSVTKVPAITHDFLPTILDLAGLKPDPRNHLDGLSLVPALEGGRVKRNALYWYFPHYDRRPVAAVRAGDFKLIEFLDDGHVELYNLAEDLGELHDLVQAMPGKAAELGEMLHRWQKSVGAQNMVPNPDYKPGA